MPIQIQLWLVQTARIIMKVALILFAVIAISQARITPSYILGRVVNGENAKPGDIPYQVSLQAVYDSFHFCGGSVLNEYYVITAAHCLQGQSASEIKVVAGTTDLREPKSTHAAEKLIVHKQYNSHDSWRHDIGLIKVKTPFVVTPFLNFVTLPTLSQDTPAESVAVVSGWGRLWEGGLTPQILQRTDIRIATQEYCRNVHELRGYSIHDSHICAYDPVSETGACHGDSGGPLTVGGKLVGLVSWGLKCASTTYPTVYTRVSEYIDWIESNAV